MNKNPDVQDSGPERKMVSRRALVRLGWIVPVVLAVGIPRNALAVAGSVTPPPTGEGGTL
jgi:hypothetical protein